MTTEKMISVGLGMKELCESCDVFAEPMVFDRLQSRRILSAAKAQGLRLRVHADEIEPPVELTESAEVTEVSVSVQTFLSGTRREDLSRDREPVHPLHARPFRRSPSR